LAGFLPLLLSGAIFLAKKQESRITGKEKNHGYDTDSYFDAHPLWYTAHPA
jgi:hypothetical protein